MELINILEDSKLNEMCEKYMGDVYGKLGGHRYIEIDDFKQEIYIYLMSYLPKYNEEKSSISTYLYLGVKQKGLNIIKACKSKRRSFDKDCLPLNTKYEGTRGGEFEVLDVVKDELVDIENDVVNDISTNDIIKLFKDEKAKNIVLLLMEGYNKREICKILKIGYTSLFQKLGNENKVNTIKYLLTRYYMRGKGVVRG